MLITSFEMDAKRLGIKEGIEQGIEKGIEKGIEQGISERNKQMVENMKKKNFDYEFISEITGLSIKEIEKL